MLTLVEYQMPGGTLSGSDMSVLKSKGLPPGSYDTSLNITGEVKDIALQFEGVFRFDLHGDHNDLTTLTLILYSDDYRGEYLWNSSGNRWDSIDVFRGDTSKMSGMEPLRQNTPRREFAFGDDEDMDLEVKGRMFLLRGLDEEERPYAIGGDFLEPNGWGVVTTWLGSDEEERAFWVWKPSKRYWVRRRPETNAHRSLYKRNIWN